MRTKYRNVIANDIIVGGDGPELYCEDAIINFTGNNNVFNKNHDLVINGVLKVKNITAGVKYNYLDYLKGLFNKL